MDDDETRARIKEIAAHCKTLLGAEDDDLFEAEDAEDDPEVKQALVEFTHVSRAGVRTARISSRRGMMHKESL